MYLNLPTVASGVLLIEMQDGVGMVCPMISVFLMLILRPNSSEDVVHEALKTIMSVACKNDIIREKL